jgi:hypothetical protein
MNVSAPALICRISERELNAQPFGRCEKAKTVRRQLSTNFCPNVFLNRVLWRKNLPGMFTYLVRATVRVAGRPAISEASPRGVDPARNHLGLSSTTIRACSVSIHELRGEKNQADKYGDPAHESRDLGPDRGL